MPSTLGYALLGLLAREPRTGYDLTRALRAPIGHFWTASHSQVYPELARLEAAGLVRHRVIDGPGPRDTKMFAVTPAGRSALAEWVVQPPAPVTARDEFLLKVYSLWTADPARASEFVAEQRARHAQTLAAYRAREAEMRAEHGTALHDPGAPAFSAYATLRRGLSFEEHAINWCDWLIDCLSGVAQPT